MEILVNNMVPGRPLFQSFIPLSSALHDVFYVPYLNAGSFAGAIAVVSLVGQDVAFIARNNMGTELCRDEKSFAAGEHLAFLVADRLPCTADSDGVVEVRATSIGLSGFGLTGHVDGAFVTQPVYGLVPE